MWRAGGREVMAVVDAEAGAAAAAGLVGAPQDGPCAGMVRLAHVPQSSASAAVYVAVCVGH